jgi:hypothetical protein
MRALLAAFLGGQDIDEPFELWSNPSAAATELKYTNHRGKKKDHRQVLTIAPPATGAATEGRKTSQSLPPRAITNQLTPDR